MFTCEFCLLMLLIRVDSRCLLFEKVFSETGLDPEFPKSANEEAKNQENGGLDTTHISKDQKYSIIRPAGLNLGRTGEQALPNDLPV